MSKWSTARNWSPQEWVSLEEAVERIRGYTGSYDSAVRDLRQHILDKELQSAAALYPRKSPVRRTMRKSTFWEKLEIYRFEKQIRVRGTVDNKPLGVVGDWVFFIRRADLDKLYPITAPSAGAAAPSTGEPSRRRPPGRAPTRGWQIEVVRELLHIERDDEDEPSVAEMCQFCEDKLDYQPDKSEMRRLLRWLRARRT